MNFVERSSSVVWTDYFLDEEAWQDGRARPDGQQSTYKRHLFRKALADRGIRHK
ncbi:hypothetical protein [Mesorhizobium sp. M0578]|uniref:hypothetical protein n=1 Tax=unclassified Mesorhizobium TaxID=325217 RepID=UPI0033363995